MINLSQFLLIAAVSLLSLGGYEYARAGEQAAGIKSKPILIAKKSKRKKKSGKAVRKRNLINQKEYRGSRGRSTDVDFEDADIAGKRENPFGAGLTQTGADKDASLINIRYHWKREMIQSTSRIRTGRR